MGAAEVGRGGVGTLSLSVRRLKISSGTRPDAVSFVAPPSSRPHAGVMSSQSERRASTRRSHRSATVVGAALVMVGVGIVLAPVSAAEGPGYGGTADQLAVSWELSPQPGALGAIGQAAPVLDARLAVQGLGFRGLSDIDLRVGDATSVAQTADQTGTVETTVPVPGGRAAPGTSVVAIGVTPSGSRRVLIGAVPPRPSGVGPQELVPIALAALGGTVLVVSFWRRRRRLVTGPATADRPADRRGDGPGDDPVDGAAHVTGDVTGDVTGHGSKR